MSEFKIAHIRRQGIDLIIIPLSGNFGSLPEAEQCAVMNELQERARAAGLAGTVVPVWDTGFGRMAFRAPRPWHPFFKNIDLYFVYRSINRKLVWS